MRSPRTSDRIRGKTPDPTANNLRRGVRDHRQRRTGNRRIKLPIPRTAFQRLKSGGICIQTIFEFHKPCIHL